MVPVPSSVPADCSTPANGALTYWLSSLPAGSVAQLGAGRCYAANGEINLYDRSNLTIDGNGATIRLLPGTGTGHTTLVRVTGGSDVTIENLALVGENASTASPADGCPGDSRASSYEWEHGIAFQGTVGGTVEHVTIKQVCGDFIEAEFDPRVPANEPAYGSPAKNIVVQNSTFDGAGRMGFGLTSFAGVTIQNNTISRVNMAGVDVELDFNQEYGQDLLVADNSFSAIRFSLLANAGAGYYPNIANITFTRNRSSQPVTCQPPVLSTIDQDPYYRRHFVITDNVLTAWGAAVDLTRVHDAQISGNTFTLKPGGGCGSTGVLLHSVVGATITANTFSGYNASYSADGPSTGVSASGNTP